MRTGRKILAVAAGMVLVAAAGCGGGDGKGTVRVASKNFTEQFILGEMMAQLMEARTGLTVVRKQNLGGTMVCHGALAEGEVDVYAEYTGTGLTAVLERDVVTNPDEAYRIVADAYPEKFRCRWLKPFGFNNTYAITVRRSQAEARGWKTVSDLAKAGPGLEAGFTAEFIERPDGLAKLKEVYGLDFAEVSDLDPGLMYEAVSKKEVDVICAFSTDGRIAAFDLVPLEDDKRIFPPYFAAPVVRLEILEAHPEVEDVLNLLAGKLDDRTMQQLNLAVDEKGQSPADVARGFLEENGLLPGVKK